MDITSKILGLPWQLAEFILQAAGVSYEVTYGKSYNRFFFVSEEVWYVYRVKLKDGKYEILLLRPMINSKYGELREG